MDNRFRDLAMVKARRALYLGTEFGPERAAFPLAQVIERRAVVADLYGPAAPLDADADALARLGRPLYVVFRPEEDSLTARARTALASRPARFEPVYARDGNRVLRLRPSAGGRG